MKSEEWEFWTIWKMNFHSVRGKLIFVWPTKFVQSHLCITEENSAGDMKLQAQLKTRIAFFERRWDLRVNEEEEFKVIVLPAWTLELCD